jgi:hypothetical protein
MAAWFMGVVNSVFERFVAGERGQSEKLFVNILAAFEAIEVSAPSIPGLMAARDMSRSLRKWGD